MDDRETVRALFDALAAHQVPYLLVGGVALLSYVDGRNPAQGSGKTSLSAGTRLASPRTTPPAVPNE